MTRRRTLLATSAILAPIVPYAWWCAWPPWARCPWVSAVLVPSGLAVALALELRAGDP
jgi:hypothetical protein